MRNFEERKAEVFRRSEDRIKERKRKRNRILALCIPLCLVVTVWSVGVLPSLFAQKGNDAECEDDGSLYGDKAPGSEGSFIEESKTHNFVSVSVQGKGYTGEITDTVSVGKVFQNIYDILDANGGYKELIGDYTENLDDVENEDMAAESTLESERYIITLESSEGNNRVYILNGNILYDQALGEEISLTKEQLNDLLVALELADY